MLNVTIGGVSSSELDLIISDYTRQLLPDNMDEYKRIEGLPGLRLVPKEPGNRRITVQFKSINNSATEWTKKAEKIAAWLYSEEEVGIYFDDEPDSAYYVGKVSNAPEISREHTVSTFEVEFTCEPYKKRNAINLVGEAGPGKPFTFTNAGTAPSPYIIICRLKSSADTFHVALNDTNIHHKGAIAGGSDVTIDGHTYELRVDGELRVLEVGGAFDAIRPGENEIRTSSAATVTVIYLEQFL